MKVARNKGNGTDRLLLPPRVFLDSSIIQVLQEYGECIYDGCEIGWDARIVLVPNGVANIEALRKIMFVGKRAMFEIVISENSLREVEARGRTDSLQWAIEVMHYWQQLLATYRKSSCPPFQGLGRSLSQRMSRPMFGYLSEKDRLLLRDAIFFECTAFVTMDRKLVRNADHLERETGLRVIEPVQWCDLIRPWAPLLG